MLSLKWILPRRERRVSPRDGRKLHGTIKYRGNYKKVTISSLNEKGAYVIVDDVLHLGDGVCLSIRLPGEGETVMVTGEVRRVGLSSRIQNRPSGFGLAFTRYYTQMGKHSIERHLSS